MLSRREDEKEVEGGRDWDCCCQRSFWRLGEVGLEVILGTEVSDGEGEEEVERERRWWWLKVFLVGEGIRPPPPDEGPKGGNSSPGMVVVVISLDVVRSVRWVKMSWW